ncbi:TPA: restriction endonuclease subunit S [Vibrio cholerae]|nr:restriction endonuclease subunit S [Vibrio cholerae]HDZ9218922.1 restriction endonuclease subunit S [Vibrio cholerae]
MNIEKNWKRISLGEFIKLKSGFAFKSKDYTKPGEGTVPIIRISDIQQGKVYTSNAEHVPSEQADVKFLIEKGDLLIAMSGATTGKTGVYSEDNIAFLNQRVGNLKLVNEEDSCLRYRDYLVQSLQSEILKRAYGAAQPNISAKEFESIEILLAPHHEQKRIANKLDAIFEKLEMAQSRLEKVPQLLKRFRMSVLSAAVSGELTEEWRDVNNAGDWSEIKVTNIVEKIEAGKNLKCHERPPREDELGIIKISAVTWGVYDEEESKTLPDSSLFLENRRINVGDFLISRANTLELLGMPVIVHQVTKNLMLSDKVWRIVAEDADKQWLSIFLRSPEGRKQIESRATGNQESMRNIAQKAFLDIDLPMPSPEEKEAIVSIVNGLFSKADLVEKQYLVAKQRVDRLTQSILARAFRGELFEPFSDKAERVAQPQSEDVIDEQPTDREETTLEQADINSIQSRPTPKTVDDKSELLSQLKSAKKAMTAQQLFDSASVETFKAIDDFFIELKRLLELNLVEKVGEGENCQFKATK